MATRQLWAAAAMTAFGAVAVLEAGKLSFGSVAQPGPGLFPLCLSVALTLTGVGTVVEALRAGAGPAAPPRAPAGGLPRAVAALAALFVYAFALERIGFLLATFLLVTFLFRSIEPQRWAVAIGGSVATALLSHLVFKVWLRVQLPAGPWGF